MKLGATEQRKSSRRVVVGFLLASILLLAVGPRFKPVAAVFSPVFVPVQSFVSVVADDVSAFISNLTKFPGLESENQQLRKQNAKLTKEVALYPLVIRENATFSRMVHFRDLNLSLVLQAARKIGQSAPGLGNSISIDVGSNNGVHIGNPVVDANGFAVGLVTGVTAASSTVGLFTGGYASLPAMDSNTGAQGIADRSDSGVPELTAVEPGQKLNVGDFVVTSGGGNQFPLGAIIGQITSVPSSTFQPQQTALIHTAADLNNLNYVQVITNFPPQTKIVYPKHITSPVNKH